MKRPASRILALVMSLVLAFAMITPLSAMAAAPQTAARGTYKTTATTLNMRSAASSSASVVCVLSYGATITVTDTSNSSWYKCFATSGSTTYSGYVSSSYVMLASGESYKITKETPLLTGAGSGTIQFTFPVGTMVNVVEISTATHVKVNYRNSKGATYTGYVDASALERAVVPDNLGVGNGQGAAGGIVTPTGTTGTTTTTTTTTSGTYKVTASGLNFRSGPGTQYSRYFVLSRNARVTLVDASNSKWYKVQYTNSKGVTYIGYVRSSYLAKV